MDRDIDEMKTWEVIAVNIVIQGEGESGEGAAQGFRISESGSPNAFRVQARHSDIRVRFYPHHIIKDERRLQCIGVYPAANDDKQEQGCNDLQF